MIILVAVDYTYSISDIMVNQINGTIAPNPYTAIGYNSYFTVRNMMYSLITGIVIPFLIFLSFTSSFINRNQNLVMYLIQVIGLLMITPLCIYLFSDVLTQLLSISILDAAYASSVYFSNFPYILIANTLMAFASFIFVQRPSG
jgi:hypothetical protein